MDVLVALGTTMAYGLSAVVTLLGLVHQHVYFCLLYTSDAADERSSVDLGGRRIIKKKKTTAIVADLRDSIRQSKEE